MTEALAGTCPVCNRTIRLARESVGKKVACRGCSTVLRIGMDDDSALVLTQLNAPAAPPEPPPASAACPACRSPVVAGDTFCPQCGADIARSRDQAAEVRVYAEQRRRKRHRAESAENKRKVGKAGMVLLLLAVVFAVLGTVGGMQARADADRFHARLARLDPDQTLQIDGVERSVDEAGRSVDSAVTLTFVVNYLLAAIMLGLFFWAKRSPFPALLTGACVYLVLIVVNAVLDPTMLFKGIMIKTGIIAALLGGMSAALRQRASSTRKHSRAAALAEG